MAHDRYGAARRHPRLFFHERDLQATNLCPVTGVFEAGSWVLSAVFLVPLGRHVVMSDRPTHWAPTPAEVA